MGTSQEITEITTYTNEIKVSFIISRIHRISHMKTVSKTLKVTDDTKETFLRKVSTNKIMAIPYSHRAERDNKNIISGHENEKIT